MQAFEQVSMISELTSYCADVARQHMNVFTSYCADVARQHMNVLTSYCADVARQHMNVLPENLTTFIARVTNFRHIYII